MFNAKQNELLIRAVDLLHEADRLIQEAMGDNEECYFLHCSIECAADDVLDAIQQGNPDIDNEAMSEMAVR